MDTKAHLANRKKINELAVQHNKLTTLVGALLNELNSIKKELRNIKTGDYSNKNNDIHIQEKPNQRFSSTNLNELRAEDILRQLSINNIEN